MKQVAMLTYTIMFDPSDTWQHVSQFESWLTNCLADYGLKAQAVRTVGNPQGQRLMIIEKQDLPALPKVKQTGTSAAKQIDKLGKKYGNR